MSRAKTLASLVLRYRWTRGVELGVWQGDTIFHLLEVSPQLQMIGVDNWTAGPPAKKSKETGVASYAGKDMAGAEALVMNRAKKFGNRVRIMKMDTVEASHIVSDGSVDFVFVDACHETAAVVADVLAWRPKLTSGGRMIGHDADWPAIQRALEQLGIRHQVLPGNVWLAL